MDILNSWKEIAAYVGRGVRTVQRWERDLGLPVHRPQGRDRSAVLAFAHELEAWLHHTPVRWQHEAEIGWQGSRHHHIAPQPVGSETASGAPVLAQARVELSNLHRSLDRARELRSQLAETTRHQHVVTATLQSSLQKITLRRRPRDSAA